MALFIRNRPSNIKPIFQYNPPRHELTRQFSSVITKEERLFVANCPELDIASQGETIEEAINNLKEAIELYLEDEDVNSPKESAL